MAYNGQLDVWKPFIISLTIRNHEGTMASLKVSDIQESREERFRDRPARGASVSPPGSMNNRHFVEPSQKSTAVKPVLLLLLDTIIDAELVS